jgi:hypothetical protein
MKTQRMKTILRYIFAAYLLPSIAVFSQGEVNTESSSQTDSKYIYFTDSENGYAADFNGKVIYKTSDGGKNWVNNTVPEENQIRQIIIESGKNKESINRKKNIKPVSGGYSDDFRVGFMPSDDYQQNVSSLAEIRFTLNKPGFVSIKIYNSAGSTIDELARSSFGAGSHEIKWNVSKFPDDVYYYSIVSNEFSETIKIITAK